MFKTLDPARDIINQITPVNETITVGGSIFSGAAAVDTNIKRFNHWVTGSVSGSYYQAIYSAATSSATSVELIDLAWGASISSSYYTGATAQYKAEKNKVYRLFAKMLLGDEDTRFNIGGVDRDDLYFMAVRRSQFKDEIKKGSVALIATFSGGSGAGATQFDQRNFSDTTATSTFTQGLRGDFGNLTSGSTTVGQVFYQAGIAVLVPHLVSNTSSNVGNFWSGTFDYPALATSASLDILITSFRQRTKTLSFVNQANLHTTFYYCRLLNDEYNYSSNPTFIDGSGRIIVTSGSNNLQTRTYITKVALLGENNEILAVGAISRPISKNPSSEYVLKVRIDY